MALGQIVTAIISFLFQVYNPIPAENGGGVSF